jgi:hypothetical protein
MTVPIKKGKNEKLITTSVHYNEPSYVARYQEAMDNYRQKLQNKKQQGTLTSSENEVLKEINTQLYNMTEYGVNIDNANFYDGVEGDKTVEYAPNQIGQITTFIGKSPQNLGFLLTKGKGVNQRFYGRDRQGNITDYDRATIEDPNNGITALGANSVEDLKKLLSTMAYDKGLFNSNASTQNPTISRKEQLKQMYFLGQEPTEAVLSIDSNIGKKLSQLSKDDQLALGIDIIPSGKFIEITLNK